ncbi:Bax inhibitor-1 family protein [Methylophilaceae bacterium]|jgi:modulator of FtsH protease|nr:BAX inhibitor (BI)-1/YccA family protein [Nitrosomonadales bacterium]MCH9782190.1 Bax inhibitor-1 family protein [Betaproteobacteria bacterium]MDA9086156.1 Bax inhibitor-1 family protein [Methylophilaceae bacterium]MBT5411634.1 BAX inhibitor (BI)-1/YccA family protein [Nitrosomonadales bacterium]MCH9842061.1 Bax inhibitor-1 family protein [Betaproteobacteria bacterium]
MQNNINNIASNTPSALATNKVLRNTYALLGVSLFPTVIGALMGMSMNWGFAASSPILFMIMTLGGIFGMFFLIQKNKNSSLGVVFLLALTFLLGLMLGPILQVAFSLSNGGQIVSLAAGGTGAIFLVLAGIAQTSKRDFSFMGKFLMIGLIMLILASLVNMFFQIPAASLAISAIAVMIFSGFILYDVNRIVKGGETNYIMATLALYMNIYNLFVNLLYLLMALMGNRD